MKRYAVSPVDGEDIIKGKRYLITKWQPDNGGCGLFSINDDVGDMLSYCLIKCGCAHINNEKWTIIEEEETSDG